MESNYLFNEPPFDGFPFLTFSQVIDKMEYLGEESSPYEVSPGTDLCLSDTYYSLGFLSYLHSYGKVTKTNEKWVLNPIGQPIEHKPYRFTLISDAVDILEILKEGPQTSKEISQNLPDHSESRVDKYLNILLLLAMKGKIEQRSKGWDATFILTPWE